MTSFPSFLNRKEPEMPDNRPAPSPIEAANQLGASVARLIAERDHLADELALCRQHNESLSARLETAERERDYLAGKANHFERFAMAIVTNFNTIRMIVDDTQRKANSLAQSGEPIPQTPQPSTPPAPPTTSDIATAAVESALRDLQHGKD